MAASTRFALSIEILLLLAKHRNEALSSEKIATSAGTNPAFIRRILIDLSKAGLIATRLGKGGGAVLAKGPKKISLLAVYQAVERAPLVREPKNWPDKPLEMIAFKNAFRAITEDAEAAFLKTLDDVSLKDLMKRAKGKAGAKARVD